MRRFLAWLGAQDRNDKTYWLGLALLFSGLAWGVSMATALTVVGAALAVESVITSYLAAVINARIAKDLP